MRTRREAARSPGGQVNGNHARPGGMGLGARGVPRRPSYEPHSPRKMREHFKRAALHSSLWLIRVVLVAPGMVVEHAG